MPQQQNSLLLILTALVLGGCGATGNKTGNAEVATTNAEKISVSKIISCTDGLNTADSIHFMNNGGLDFEATIPNTVAPPATRPEGMVYISGGSFSMGCVNPVGMNDGGPATMNDARPVHRVYVDPFFMDETEVTNAQFAAFVKATNYKTVAERTPTKEEFPGASAESLIAGSIVFTPPAYKVDLNDYFQWWAYIPGADWKHPGGPKTSITGKENYPVVQVCWEDAAAYAKWAGKRLPTEAEWEFAARGGRPGELYPWGNPLKPGGKWMANIFQGSFPDNDAATDGFEGLAPVRQFEPNAYGLYDLAGNVWEWCHDWYSNDYYASLNNNAATKNPQGPGNANDPEEPGSQKKVHRGGSFLCTDQYCTRYMVGTRGKGEYRSAANHIGFRCVKNVK